MLGCNTEQVQIVRGDTLLFSVRVKADSITDKVTCRITVADSSTVIFNKTFNEESAGVFKVWLEPAETQTLNEGEYSLGIMIEDDTTTPALKKQVIRSLRVFAGIAS